MRRFLLVAALLVGAGCTSSTPPPPQDLSPADADCLANPSTCCLCSLDEHCNDPAYPRCHHCRCVACLPAPALDNCALDGKTCLIVNGTYACR